MREPTMMRGSHSLPYKHKTTLGLRGWTNSNNWVSSFIRTWHRLATPLPPSQRPRISGFRCLNKVGLRPQTLRDFYQGTIESLLTDALPTLSVSGPTVIKDTLSQQPVLLAALKEEIAFFIKLWNFTVYSTWTYVTPATTTLLNTSLNTHTSTYSAICDYFIKWSFN